MVERVIAVRFSAQVSNFLANMEKVRKAQESVGSEAERAKRKLELQSKAMTDIGTGMLAIGTVAAVGIGLAVSKFADFDQAMSNVKAATQETAENMGLLREAALEAGASSVFTASEAANAIEELGKAGLSTEQILNGGLSGALSLAAAGQIGVAEAAASAAIAVKQFNLEGADVPHVADLLAAGAGKAVGDVADLSAALGQAGLVANGAGQSIEDTTGVLAAFADAGLIGSDAGTSLKSAIIALQAPTAKSKAVMDEYKLSFYDGSGAMLSYAEIAGQLETRMGTLDDETRNAALATIFGNDALRSANVLFSEGADGIQGYIDRTNDSGYAAKVAADRLNNLSGDVEKLGGAFDTYLIKSGSGANDVLRTLTQGATGLVDAVGSLPEPVLGTGLAIGGLVTVVALAGGTMLVAVPKVAAFKASLTQLGISGGTAARGVGALSIGLVAAGAAFGLFAAHQAQATAGAQEFKDSLDPATGAITDYTREIVAKKLAESGAFDSAKAAGISQKELTNAVLEGGDALEKVKNTLSGRNSLVSFFDFSEEGGIAAGNAQTTIRELSENLVEGKKDLADQAAAADGSAQSTEDAAESYKSAADTTSEYANNLTTLIDTLNKANGIGQDAVSTNAAFQASLEDARTATQEYIDANGASTAALDESTVAGSANADMLAGLAAKSQEAAQAALDAGGSAEDYKATLESGRQAIYDTALALTGNADAAQALTDKIYAMPSDKEISIVADTSLAAQQLQTFLAELNNIPGRREVVIDYVVKQTGAARGEVGAAYEGRATGGAITGPGTGTSDSIPVLLSNGEHVLTAADVAAMGGQGGVYEFRRNLYQGFAKGGAVRYSPADRLAGGSSSSVTNTPTLNQTNNFPPAFDPAEAADLAASRAANKLRRLV